MIVENGLVFFQPGLAGWGPGPGPTPESKRGTIPGQGDHVSS